jgi:hypothetical protein
MPEKHDFQKRASEVGKYFSDICRVTLESIGFKLLGKTIIKEAGIEIDEKAENQQGEPVYFEFKGSTTPPRPGLLRTDTVKKALCNAFLMDRLGIGPFIIITSHMPVEGSSGDKMLKCAKGICFDIITLMDQQDMHRLKSYVNYLPWRSRVVAKRQTQVPAEKGLSQASLFGVDSLRSFATGREKETHRKVIQAKKEESSG